MSDLNDFNDAGGRGSRTEQNFHLPMKLPERIKWLTCNVTVPVTKVK